MGRELLGSFIVYKSFIKVAKIKKPVRINPAVLFDLKVSRQFLGFSYSNFKSWKVKWKEKRRIPVVRTKI